MIAHFKPLLRTLIAAAVLAATANVQATDLFSGTLTLSASDPTQLGRLSRSGVPSDWSVAKAFPGSINPATPYAYKTLTFNLAALATAAGLTYAPFIQISIDSPSINTFFSGYAGSYSPASPATNYLGDAGSSGNSFGTNPRFFQLVVPSTQSLVLLMNETSGTGLGLNASAGILIEAFRDASFTDLAPIPEPATVALFGLGIATILAVRRHKASAV